MSAPLAWVVGRGGLLGRNVESMSNDAELWRPSGALRWDEASAALSALSREADSFLESARYVGAPWRVFWCAGAGVVATSPEALAEETAVAAGFAAHLAEQLAVDPALARRGTVFLASSAGGVYAGSSARHPFDEDSPVGAIAPYGHAKLAQEEHFTRAAEACGVDLVLGRLSNLYGPGQNLSKPQGLVAHVGKAALLRQPISIYVPLDTIRDYLFVTDAARMVVGAVERREAERRAGAARTTVIKIFASEVETSVASVLGTWRRVLRRPLRVALASNPVGNVQPRTLAFRSRLWPDLRGVPMPFHLGVDAVRRDQLERLLAAGLG